MQVLLWSLLFVSSGHLTLVQVTPVRVADVRLVPRKLLSDISALAKLALVRFVPAPPLPSKLTLDRVVPLRSTLLMLESWKYTPDRLLSLKSTPLKFDEVM